MVADHRSFPDGLTEGSRIAFLLLFFICATKARQTPARLGERAYEIGVCSLPLKNDCQRMNWELNLRMLCEIPALVLCPKPASSLHDWSSSGLQFCEGFLSSQPQRPAREDSPKCDRTARFYSGQPSFKLDIRSDRASESGTGKRTFECSLSEFSHWTFEKSPKNCQNSPFWPLLRTYFDI